MVHQNLLNWPCRKFDTFSKHEHKMFYYNLNFSCVCTGRHGAGWTEAWCGAHTRCSHWGARPCPNGPIRTLDITFTVASTADTNIDEALTTGYCFNKPRWLLKPPDTSLSYQEVDQSVQLSKGILQVIFELIFRYVKCNIEKVCLICSCFVLIRCASHKNYQIFPGRLCINWYITYLSNTV